MSQIDSDTLAGAHAFNQIQARLQAKLHIKQHRRRQQRGLDHTRRFQEMVHHERSNFSTVITAQGPRMVGEAGGSASGVRPSSGRARITARLASAAWTRMTTTALG